jgi:hypothetical protein
VPVSFANDVMPLFRARDISCMSGLGVLLNDYAYMADPLGNGSFPDHANARDVLSRLTGASQPRMPMGGPYWPAAQIATFEKWIEDGFPP